MLKLLLFCEPRVAQHNSINSAKGFGSASPIPTPERRGLHDKTEIDISRVNTQKSRNSNPGLLIPKTTHLPRREAQQDTRRVRGWTPNCTGRPWEGFPIEQINLCAMLAGYESCVIQAL